MYTPLSTMEYEARTREGERERGVSSHDECAPESTTTYLNLQLMFQCLGSSLAGMRVDSSNAWTRSCLPCAGNLLVIGCSGGTWLLHGGVYSVR